MTREEICFLVLFNHYGDKYRRFDYLVITIRAFLIVPEKYI